MGELRSLCEDVWVVDHPLSVGGMALGTRMTVVRLEGDLLLISPVPIDDVLAEAIGGLGEVKWLVSPNNFHHLFLGPAGERFPSAQVFSSLGLEAKLKKKAPKIDAEIDPKNLPFPGMDALLVGGMPKLNETAFLHRASKTLILTDLLFNIVNGGGWFSRMMLGMSGALGPYRNSRYLKFLVKDKEAHRAGIQEILTWDFDRVILCHGDVVESGGKEALRTGAGWNLPAEETQTASPGQAAA